MTLADSVIAVTGANGFVGRALCQALSARGAVVRALVRKPQQHSDLLDVARGGAFEFDLAGDIDPAGISPPATTVVHCAYLIGEGDSLLAAQHNLEGTRRLLSLCNAHGIAQFLFISSLAAHEKARSTYGRTKWLLENEVAAAGGTVIKPGTILGSGGVYGRLRILVRKQPFIPVFYNRGRRIQTVLIDDLCASVLGAVEGRKKGAYVVAESDGVSPAEFYRGTAALEGKRARLIRLSGDPALLLARAAEALGVRLPVTSDNLLGLKCLRHFEAAESANALGVSCRDFWSSLATLAGRENNPAAWRAVAELRGKSQT